MKTYDPTSGQLLWDETVNGPLYAAGLWGVLAHGYRLALADSGKPPAKGECDKCQHNQTTYCDRSGMSLILTADSEFCVPAAKRGD